MRLCLHINLSNDRCCNICISFLGHCIKTCYAGMRLHNHSARIDEGQRLGMIDSGCNTLILKLDAEVASIVTGMNTSEAFSGSAASSPFNTVGLGLLGIQCTYIDTNGNAGAFEEVTKASFAYDWNFDLFPTHWFQKLGHTVIFNGHQSLYDTSQG